VYEQPGITFYSSPAILVVGLVVVCIVAALSWLAWQRSGYARNTGMLELLRFVLACLVVVTLNQPEWLELRPPDQRPTLAVLWDQSGSMETRDVINDGPPSDKPASRAETIQPLLSAASWKPDGSDLHIVLEPFSSRLDPAEEGTDLNAGLTSVLENHASLLGVVLLSDGDWNVGRPPVEAATRCRMRGVPVFAVGVGSKVALPDLELVSMDAPTYGVAGKPLRIPFVVRSTLGQGRDVSVELSIRAGKGLTRDQPSRSVGTDSTPDPATVATKVVRVPAMGQAQQALAWTPPGEGEFTLTMRVPQDSDELVAENNEISAPIVVRREELKVLLVESYPRWEYRYLRNALERDPGVEVTCLLFHPDLKGVGGGRGYIKEFPTAQELNRYDVVFLGDVGIGPDQLTNEQAKDLRQLVTAQTSGLVFLPGYTGQQHSLTTSALGDLYPVVLDPARTEGIGSALPGHFSLTERGHRSLLTRLHETDETNDEIWRTLPGFHWYAGILRAKAGSEILAVHARATTEHGRVPLIVTKTYGTGKVLLMGTDGAWRWREGVEDQYHYRFWGQVARWMAYQRKMAEGQSMRLFYSPDRPRVGDVVTLNANVMDAQGAPLAQGTVTVQAISPSGKTKTIRLQSGERGSWGLFVGTFIAGEPGDYRLMTSCSETGASVQTDLSVQGLNRELRGRLARFDVLDEIAQVSKGKLVPVSEAGDLADYLAALPDPEPTVHRVRIWAHPFWAGLLVLLLGVFWVGRKMVGTI